MKNECLSVYPAVAFKKSYFRSSAAGGNK